MTQYFETIVVCGDGREYNLGRGEFPPQPPIKGNTRLIEKPEHRVVNAFTREKTEVTP